MMTNNGQDSVSVTAACPGNVMNTVPEEHDYSSGTDLYGLMRIR